MAVAVHIYFIWLMTGFNSTVMAMLEYRAEKDADIAILKVDNRAVRRQQLEKLERLRGDLRQGLSWLYRLGGQGYLRLSLQSGAGQFEPWSSAAMAAIRPAATVSSAASEAPDRRGALIESTGRDIRTLPSAERYGIRPRQEAAAITVTFKDAPAPTKSPVGTCCS